MPQRLRVDNGPPWGSGSDLPRELALWLVGLGIDVIWNHPYRPQENGVVERAHGTTKNWVEPSTCANLTELQRRLDRAADLQRSRYPYRQGRSREQYYDTLSRGGVPYRQNPESWRLDRVDALLAQGLWTRRVDCCGKISIYGRNYSIGRQYARQSVLLTFQSSSRSWQVWNEQGDCLKTMPTRELSQESITTLTVTQPRRRCQNKKKAKLNKTGLT
jgi:hypothetical protein